MRFNVLWSTTEINENYSLTTALGTDVFVCELWPLFVSVCVCLCVATGPSSSSSLSSLRSELIQCSLARSQLVLRPHSLSGSLPVVWYFGGTLFSTVWCFYHHCSWAFSEKFQAAKWTEATTPQRVDTSVKKSISVESNLSEG